MRSAEASSEVRAPVDEVFRFLADLGNHWRLASRWIEVVDAAPGGQRGRQRDGHPEWSARSRAHRADTRWTRSRRHPRSAVTATSGRTHADVSWTLAPATGATRVSVEVRLIRASLADRAIWLCFGRAWLARRLQLTVSGLDDVLVAVAAAA